MQYHAHCLKASRGVFRSPKSRLRTGLTWRTFPVCQGWFLHRQCRLSSRVPHILYLSAVRVAHSFCCLSHCSSRSFRVQTCKIIWERIKKVPQWLKEWLIKLPSWSCLTCAEEGKQSKQRREKWDTACYSPALLKSVFATYKLCQVMSYSGEVPYPGCLPRLNPFSAKPTDMRPLVPALTMWTS